MVTSWRHGYIHGPREALLSWELNTFPPDSGETEPKLDGSYLFHAKGIYPMDEGTPLVDDEGRECIQYYIDTNNPNVLVLVSIQPEGEVYIPLIEAIPGVTLHMDATPEQMASLYPEFARGQAIPRIHDL